ncbi:hypothetical protein ACJW30_11G152900 [Castanea mollissima]
MLLYIPINKDGIGKYIWSMMPFPHSNDARKCIFHHSKFAKTFNQGIIPHNTKVYALFSDEFREYFGLLNVTISDEPIHQSGINKSIRLNILVKHISKEQLGSRKPPFLAKSNY